MLRIKNPNISEGCGMCVGMSRPHLVKLVDAGKMPHHMVGSHRRVYLHDLLEFARRRNAERSKDLTQLTKRIESEGFYDSDYTGESDDE